LFVLLVVTACCLGGARRVEAQGFISPFIGYNFGGDASCPEITNCKDKHMNWGASFGALGPIVGFEAEIAYTTDFFGQTANANSNVLTFMSNFMLAPRFGPVQPYGLAGVGLIRTSVDSAGTAEDQNQFGWDGGGGLMVFFGRHVGARGEVRYYHSFQALDFLNLSGLPVGQLDGKNLDYGRFAGAIVFRF
jgi:opacity protein-like surface antigen